MTALNTQEIILASGNSGKIREIQALLPEFRIIPQSNYHIPEAEETGTTFIENAIIKARNAAEHSGLPAIADDSGLVVDALEGAPGVYSARYAGVDANDQANLQKVLDDMVGVPEPQRSARFICVLVFMAHQYDPQPLIAEGVWEGQILLNEQGENGFGYDPIFWVPECKCSSAQLTPDQKNSLSHRGQALRTLTLLLENR